MKDKIKIRKAELRDAVTIAKFNTILAKETENMELDSQTAVRGAKAIIKDPHKGFYLVAEMKGEIIGLLMVTNEWSDWRNKYFFWIQSLYVREDCIEKGILSSLLLHLKDIACYKKNVAGLRLYVEVSNKTAREAQEELGMYKAPYEMYEILL
jgi:hypothetical protein